MSTSGLFNDEFVDILEARENAQIEVVPSFFHASFILVSRSRLNLNGIDPTLSEPLSANAFPGREK